MIHCNQSFFFSPFLLFLGSLAIALVVASACTTLVAAQAGVSPYASGGGAKTASLAFLLVVIAFTLIALL